MKRKSLEISISKEEKRIINLMSGSGGVHLDTASCWVKLGLMVEFEKDDTTVNIAEEIRAELQPFVDDWLMRQGGYVMPLEDAAPPEELPELTDEAAIQAHLSGAFGPKVEVKVTELPINGDSDHEKDEIPL